MPFAKFTSLCCCAAALVVHAQQRDTVKAVSQNPSPMVEYTRQHERIPLHEYEGTKFEVAQLFAKPVEVFIPRKSRKARTLDVLWHFHGANYLVQHAAAQYRGNLAAISINLGSGSSVYGRAFEDATKFTAALDSILFQLERHLGHAVQPGKIILSGFSAGYGAVRKILSTQSNFARVDAVLLLDGLHASYIPEGKVLAEGGVIDSTGLAAFMRFASNAARRESTKQLLITHSEIFPGTFVSTTEASNFILQALGMKREAVLKWGPLGMQQLSVARRGRFEVQGFAGNTAPDHIDHLHAVKEFLRRLREL
ncbi:hypothetical protein HUU05_15595 [candidate division KSB1 bacterium]|nr:hypothetical protein [candidate division KSB1 bacterium]